MPYLDTSVIGAYYCPEPLSHLIDQAYRGLRNALISPLVELEFCSLLSLKVRTHELDRRSAHQALAKFRLHLADGLYTIIEIGSREHDIARTWVSGFSTALRTLDALHLACAFVNRQPIWTSDKYLAQAAEGLGVDYQLFLLESRR